MSLISTIWDITKALVLSALFFLLFNLLLVVLISSSASLTSEGTLSSLLQSIGGLNYLFIVLISILITHLTYLMYSRRVSHLSQEHLQIRGSAMDMITGFLTAFVLFSLIVLILVILDVVKLSVGKISFVLLISLSLSLQAAYSEELILRGILYRRLSKTVGGSFALVTTSIIFGILHLVNPGASVLGTLNIILTAGIILGASYAITSRLWFPIMFHFSWNLTQGGLYGLPISGISSPGLLSPNIGGHILLTGGEFGIEASILTTLVLLPVALSIVWIMYKRPNWNISMFRYLDQTDKWNDPRY